MFNRRVTRSALLLAGVIAIATPAMAKNWGPWGAPVSVEALPGSSDLINLPTSNDGCPVQSPDGLSLYFASNRAGSAGLDIWVAHRDRKDGGWGAPENLGPEVNSSADDFCPFPAPGGRLFFVSKRTETNGDIYMTRETKGGWTTPVHLGPNVNSGAQEWSPSYFEDEQGRGVLYFSSTRNNGQQDIYASIDLAPAVPVSSLNTAFDDARPNVSKDGLEIVFDSTRQGGLPDIWTASRQSTDDPWSDIVHLENGINTAAAETRATMSRDGSTLLFGSTRNGGPADIFVSFREKVTGKK